MDKQVCGQKEIRSLSIRMHASNREQIHSSHQRQEKKTVQNVFFSKTPISKFHHKNPEEPIFPRQTNRFSVFF